MKSLDLDLEGVHKPLFLLLVRGQTSTQHFTSSSQKGLQLDWGLPRRRRQGCRHAGSTGTPAVRNFKQRSLLQHCHLCLGSHHPSQLYPYMPCIGFCSDSD